MDSISAEFNKWRKKQTKNGRNGCSEIKSQITKIEEKHPLSKPWHDGYL